MKPAPNPSTPEATRNSPFNLPLRNGGYGDDIIDAAGNLTIQLYGDERVPETLEQREYVLRAVNSYDDMLAALKAARESLRDQYGINVVPRHRSLADCFAELKQIDAAIQKAEAK